MTRAEQIEQLRLLLQEVEHKPLYDQLAHLVDNGIGNVGFTAKQAKTMLEKE